MKNNPHIFPYPINQIYKPIENHMKTSLTHPFELLFFLLLIRTLHPHQNGPVRPPFQTTINQNSMSSSSFINTHVRPPFQTTLYENPASRSSSTHSQSLQSHPIQYQPTLYQTSASSSSLLDNE